MKKVLLFLFLLPLSVFAQNYINEFPIYVHGDVRPIAAVFNSIAIITNHGIYETMIWFGVISSALVIAFSLAFKSDLGGAVKSGVFLIGSISILLVPVDVHIIDKRLDYGVLSPKYTEVTLGYEKVSNVPYLTAIAPSIATTISADVISLIDDGFSGNTLYYSGMEDIGKVGFGSLGFGGAFETINKILKQFSYLGVNDPEAVQLEKNLRAYISGCVIPSSTNNNLVSKAMVAPNMDVFSAISPNNIVITPGLDVAVDGAVTPCSTFYNNEILPKITSIQPKVNERLQEITNVSNIASLSGIEKIALGNITSDIFATSVEPISIFAQNYAVAPIVKIAVENYYRGTSMSGVDIANSITGATSTAKLQTEGLGNFKWTIQILPYALHFLFTVIIASSILALIFLMARGFIGGFSVAKNYFVGFIQFESIRIAMALVNNLVLFYSAINATDKMAEFGGNPASITKIPEYLQYIASMEGLMGVLGISAIFLIPAIVFKGDLSMAASSIQGLSNRYVGNDLATSRQATANAVARQKTTGAIMNDEQAMAKLHKMGINTPKGRLPLEYYQAVMNDMKSMGQAAGSMVSYDKADDFASGSMKQSANMISQTAGYGATTSLNSASNVGYQDGQAMGHTVNNTDSLRKEGGWNASRVGRGRALEALSKDLSSMGTDSAVSGSEVEQFAKGSENQGRINANKTLGAGRMTLSKADMSAIQDSVEAGIASEIGKGRGMKIAAKAADESLRDFAEKSSEVSTAKSSMSTYALGSKLNSKRMEEMHDKFLNMEDAEKNKMFTKEDLADMKTEGRFKTGAEAAAWLASKQAGHLQGMHGLSIAGKTVGVSVGDDNVRVADISGGTKVDTGNIKSSLDSTTTGSKSEHFNEQMMLHNTAPLVSLAMKRFGGDIKKAAEWARSHDGAKWMMDPRNELAVAAAETGFQISEHGKGLDEEGSAMTTMALTGGAVGTYFLNKFTQAPVKADLSKATPTYGKEGNITGYTKDGIKYANASGHLLDSSGQVVKRGVVSRGARGIWNKIDPFDINLQKNSSENLDSYSNNSSSNKNSSNPEYSTRNHNDSFSNNLSNDSINSGKNLQYVTKEELNAMGGLPDNPNVRTNSILETIRKMPLVGKVVGAAAIGATMAQANDYFQNGEYARAAFTMTSSVDPTGGSDMALAMMESQDIRHQALNGRSLSGQGNSWGQQFSNVMSNITNSSAFRNTFGSSISPAAATAIQQPLQANQMFATAFRDANVQQEFANMFAQTKMGTSIANDTTNEMLMKTQVEDISNTLKRNGTNTNDSGQSTEAYLEDIKKELRRVRRVRG